MHYSSGNDLQFILRQKTTTDLKLLSGLALFDVDIKRIILKNAGRMHFDSAEGSEESNVA